MYIGTGYFPILAPSFHPRLLLKYTYSTASRAVYLHFSRVRRHRKEKTIKPCVVISKSTSPPNYLQCFCAWQRHQAILRKRPSM